MAVKAVVGDGVGDWEVVATAVGRPSVYCRAQYARIGGGVSSAGEWLQRTESKIELKPQYADRRGVQSKPLPSPNEAKPAIVQPSAGTGLETPCSADLEPLLLSSDAEDASSSSSRNESESVRAPSSQLGRVTRSKLAGLSNAGGVANESEVDQLDDDQSSNTTVPSSTEVGESGYEDETDDEPAVETELGKVKTPSKVDGALSQ